jgi:hypothetical protein
MEALEIQTYPYEKRYWYPHMAANDAPIWERFIDAHPDFFEQVQYDVPVGSVPDHATESVVAGGESMHRLYKRRIDVVGFTIGAIYVVEVKPIATTSTVGQALGYDHLYVRDMQPERETRPMIVCGSIDADAMEFAKAQGVSVFVV